MLELFAPIPAITLALLLVAFVLVLLFEFSNGFHDTANAVATVIYTRSLDAVPAVVWSGLWNFAGVMLSGTAVAFAIVNLLPPEVIDGCTFAGEIAMLFAVLLAALLWNVGTWYLGLPSSSSHAIIGAILGVGLAVSLTPDAGVTSQVSWSKAREIGLALLISPTIGFGLALVLLLVSRRLLRSPELHRPPGPDHRPPYWLRGLLMSTCAGVSFFHGSNDGQKTIGFLMIVVLTLLPFDYAVNLRHEPAEFARIAAAAAGTRQAIATYERATAEASGVRDDAGQLEALMARAAKGETLSGDDRMAARKDAYHLIAYTGHLAGNPALPAETRASLAVWRGDLRRLVEFVPGWVMLLSALALAAGTMIGYQRIVRTIGERIGRTHLTPAQGGVAEVVAMGTIGLADFGGVPVSTTHVLSSGVAGTMVAQGTGIQPATVRSLVLAWVLTLPATIALSSGIYIVLERLLRFLL
jgi:inorganic phosphate transporter, PiT family